MTSIVNYTNQHILIEIQENQDNNYFLKYTTDRLLCNINFDKYNKAHDLYNIIIRHINMLNTLNNEDTILALNSLLLLNYSFVNNSNLFRIVVN
jgi:hypothetical protein